MPRVEVLGYDPKDLCASCFRQLGLKEGDDGDLLSQDFEDTTIGSVDVEHPNYNDDLYTCFYCGEVLNEEDDR